MDKIFVYLYRILLKNAKNSIMRMIKKYWWLLALGALAYWKWDEIKAMFGKSDLANPEGIVPENPMYTGTQAMSILPELNHDLDNNGIPDYLQGN